MFVVCFDFDAFFKSVDFFQKFCWVNFKIVFLQRFVFLIVELFDVADEFLNFVIVLVALRFELFEVDIAFVALFFVVAKLLDLLFDVFF